MDSTNGPKIQPPEGPGQGKSIRGASRRNLTILSEAQLAHAPESALLHLAFAVFGVSNPNLNQHAAFAEAAGVSRTTLVKALAGETHIGGEAWRRIERTLNMEVYQEWLKSQ
jgi:hypothetical protein